MSGVIAFINSVYCLYTCAAKELKAAEKRHFWVKLIKTTLLLLRHFQSDINHFSRENSFVTLIEFSYKYLNHSYLNITYNIIILYSTILLHCIVWLLITKNIKNMIKSNTRINLGNPECLHVFDWEQRIKEYSVLFRIQITNDRYCL